MTAFGERPARIARAPGRARDEASEKGAMR